MLIKTLKLSKKGERKIDYTINTDIEYITNNSLKRSILKNLETMRDIRNKSIFKFNDDSVGNFFLNPSTSRKQKSVAFENQYLKSLTKNRTMEDQRKKQIKEKIKGKIKQQYQFFKKRDYKSVAVRQFREKQDSLRDIRIEAEIKGNQINKKIQIMIDQIRNQCRVQSAKKLVSRKLSTKQSITSPEKSLKRFQHTQTKIRSKRTLSNAFNGHRKVDCLPRTLPIFRNSQSALDQIKTEMQNSGQIEPWNYTDEF